MREISDEVLFDKRLLERHVAQGLVTQEQVTQHLDSVADTEDQSENIDVEAMRKPPATNPSET